jgi:D-alanyl-D-alanine carboxypeptidase
MTAYVTLTAIKQHRISLDTLFTVSPNAVAEPPAKMGLPAGTQITVDNALKMMMVKSANDIAVVIAEGVSGSVENFAAEMNRTAARLGMTQTHYVNPNGLPAEGHVSSARDQAMLARAIIRDLPEYEYYVHIPAIKFGKRTIRNYNTLIGRYAGADGMKTGFICASGFNLVGSATRNGKRIIAVVLGAQSSSMRTLKAAQLMERGFSSSGLSWLAPSLGTVDALVPVNAEPPNLREEMCGPKRKRPAAESDDADDEVAGSGEAGVSLYSGLRGPGTKWADLIGPVPAIVDATVVYTGPKREGPPVIASVSTAPAAKPKAAAKAAKPAAKPTAVAAKPPASTPAAAAKKPNAVSAAAKPAAHTAPKAAAPKTAAPKAAAPKAAASTTAPKATTAATAKPAATAAKPVAATTAAKPAPRPAPTSSAAKLDAKNEIKPNAQSAAAKPAAKPKPAQ